MRDWQTDGTLVNNEDITKFLPILHEAHMTLEHATRHAWDKTSYIRDSPNHSKAWALDVAPKIGLDLRPYYSYFKKSDPVLYKRVELLNRLKTIPASVFAAKLRNLLDNKNLSVGYFIEPDHIHIQLLKRKKQGERFYFVPWPVMKACYPDTARRWASDRDPSTNQRLR